MTKDQMTEDELHELLGTISEPDEVARIAVANRWDQCAKPLGSLGRLEDAIVRIGALTGSASIDISRREVIVFCADNGVAVQGVTQSDSAVTALLTSYLVPRRTSVCVMAQAVSCEVLPVDMGVLDYAGDPGVLDRRIGNGTRDMSVGPAMTRTQALKGIQCGIELVEREQKRGVHLLATGEIGMGNTTSAAAVACALLGEDPTGMVGRGAGLSDEGLKRKIAAVHQALLCNADLLDDPLGILAAVGGFDIAAMVGVFLGGALYKVPVLIDGLISSVAALVAYRMAPVCHKAMLASHISSEPAAERVLAALSLKPLICAEMRLGEGTGAVCAIPLLDMALAVYRDALTYGDLDLASDEGKPC